jgi:hypothetical protein
MELLPGDDTPVTDLPPDDQNNDFFPFHIVQDSEIACAEFVLREWVRPQLLDGLGQRRRLVFEARGDGRFEDPLIPDRQLLEVPLSIFGDRDAERHRSPPSAPTGKNRARSALPGTPGPRLVCLRTASPLSPSRRRGNG